MEHVVQKERQDGPVEVTRDTTYGFFEENTKEIYE